MITIRAITPLTLPKHSARSAALARRLWRVLALLPALVFVGCSGLREETMSEPSSHPAAGLYFRTTSLRGVEYPFAVYVPPNLESAPGHGAARLPAAVFLNGSGECGTDGTRQLTQGMFPAMLSDPEAWPLIGIFPQKPTRESVWDDHTEVVLACVRCAVDEFKADPDRMALTGLSQGGRGTWMIAAATPGTWSCLAPICGPMKGVDIDAVAGAIDPAIAVRAFHGTADSVVPASDTLRTAEALRTRRSVLSAPASSPSVPDNVSITLYEGIDHNSWDRAYRSEGLGIWMAAQKRPAR